MRENKTFVMTVALDEETRKILIEGAKKMFGNRTNLSAAIRYAIRQTFGDQDEKKTS